MTFEWLLCRNPGNEALGAILQSSSSTRLLRELTAAMAADISHESVDGMIEQLWKCEYIKESHVKALCIKAREILVVWNCRREVHA